jgi:hypothetical protein
LIYAKIVTKLGDLTVCFDVILSNETTFFLSSQIFLPEWPEGSAKSWQH